MSLIKCLATAISVLALTAVGPAFAQIANPPGSSAGNADESWPGSSAQTPDTRSVGRESAPGPSAEDLRNSAQALAIVAGLTCQVTEAANPGVTAELTTTYEAVCADGPGYILIASAPPQSFNCLELAGTAATTRLRDPAADVGQQCAMAANQNGVAVIGGFIAEAGLPCTVDQAAAIGKSPDGGLVYEASCTEGAGYRIEKVESGWKTTPCWDAAFSSTACRFTTTAEALTAWRGVLAGSPAASCDVLQGRRVGRDAQGLTVYEVKCAAGDGYFVRIDTDWKAQLFHPCATAQNIGGGCTLTPATAAAPQADKP